jgi:hypothetical protein
MYRIATAAVALGLAAGAGAQETKAEKSTVKALEAAMTPGEGQKRLEFLIGTYDVNVRVWLDPAKPPIESTATSVGTWVLGNRYVQQMLSGHVMGEAWNGIGYAGFDNVSQKYVVTYMDDGSTGMEWYTGTMNAAGTNAKLTGTMNDPVTGKAIPIELRLRIDPKGDHVTELWQADRSGKLQKTMELEYVRKTS